jgi:hypothetical protein
MTEAADRGAEVVRVDHVIAAMRARGMKTIGAALAVAPAPTLATPSVSAEIDVKGTGTGRASHVSRARSGMVSMIDERYSRSADVRLQVLRRVELGIPPRPPVLSTHVDPSQIDPGQVEEIRSRTPRTTSLQQATLALPVDTTYRENTVSVDGTPGSDAIANELFENGTDLGAIELGARGTVVVKLVVEVGVGDIILSRHLSAAAEAVLGLRGMRLKRAEPPARGVSVQRPLYESDSDEAASGPLVAPANLPTITALQPAEYSPIIIAVPPNEPAFVLKSSPLGEPHEQAKTVTHDNAAVSDAPSPIGEPHEEAKTVTHDNAAVSDATPPIGEPHEQAKTVTHDNAAVSDTTPPPGESREKAKTATHDSIGFDFRVLSR